MTRKTAPAPDDLHPPADDPYFYGWRMVPWWKADGSQEWRRVPLTAWDVLHPEEDDFIVQSDAHDRDCHYLKDALDDAVRGRAGVRAFHDLRIDWQVRGVKPHGPDLSVFEGIPPTFDPTQGTLRVRDAGARPLLAVEVVSPNTRDVDLNQKPREYRRAGVPVYVIVDRVGDAVTVGGYRLVPDRKQYEPIPGSPDGVWVESVGLWFRSGGDRVACFRGDGSPVLDRAGLNDERDAFKARAEAQAARADSAEQARAEAERRNQELLAELARLRGGNPPTTPNT
jgi:Uma2 family endonuclease